MRTEIKDVDPRELDEPETCIVCGGDEPCSHDFDAIGWPNVKHIHPPTPDSAPKNDAPAGWMVRLVVLSFLFALGVVLMVSSLGLMLLSDCLGSWAIYASCPLLAIGGIMTMLTGIHWPPRESKKSHEL